MSMLGLIVDGSGCAENPFNPLCQLFFYQCTTLNCHQPKCGQL